MKTETKLPFERPMAISIPCPHASPLGYRLSADDNPVRFLAAVYSMAEVRLLQVFATEKDAWRELAYQALERGHDPAPYIEMALA